MHAIKAFVTAYSSARAELLCDHGRWRGGWMSAVEFFTAKYERKMLDGLVHKYATWRAGKHAKTTVASGRL